MLKPYDLNTTLLSTDLSDDATIAELRAAITPSERTNTCPQCTGQAYVQLQPWEGEGEPPLVHCPTCDGYGKTVGPYAQYCAAPAYGPVIS